MSSSGEGRYDAQLERALVDLSRYFPYPPTPDVAASVVSRLEGMGRRSLDVSGRRPHLRTVVFGTLATVLLLVGATLAVSPAARAAVAQWLGIPGVRITTGSAPLPAGRLGRTLDLGQRVTLATAEHRVSFHLFLPTLPGLGRPDEVYLDTSPPGGRISLLYRSRPSLPPTRETGVGLLLTEFRATDDQVWLGKNVGWRSLPEGIAVGADHGYWIKGAHLIYTYRTDEGRVVWNNVRLAGSTLLWNHAGLTLRLESALSERAAIRIAMSMR